MPGPQTICPKCGHSPIPDGAEVCPKCHDVFALTPHFRRAQKIAGHNQRVEDAEGEATATRLGGITDAVTAQPGPATACLGLGAGVWLLKGLGLWTVEAQPLWYFGVAGVLVVAAMFVITASGPARPFAQLAAIVQSLGAIAATNKETGGLVPTVFFLLFGMSLLLLTAGEPGPKRRTAGLIAGLTTGSACAVCVVLLG